MTPFVVLCSLCCIILLLSLPVQIHCASSSDEVKSLPGIGNLVPRTHSGLLLANKEYGAYLYYLLMESLSNADQDPLFLWLQGGPGSSSMFGAFVENGPYRILPNGTFVWNDYAWNTNASVLWIDQPVGTGFSFVQNASGYVRHERELAKDLATALAAFMKLHPKFSSSKFYIFGESYGGKYAPWLAYTILSNSLYGLRVDGIALGDGWVSPAYQTPSNPRYLYNRSRISEDQWASANVTLVTFLDLLAQQRYIEAWKLDTALFNILCIQGGVTDAFDIRQEHDPTIPPNQAMNKWLETAQVRAALNVGNDSYNPQGITAYDNLDDDEELDALNVLSYVIKQRPVLLYNGEWDMVCNYFGTQEYAWVLDWEGRDCYRAAPTTTWMLNNGTVGGWLQAFGNLSRLVIVGAGHMSPFDQPYSLHQMVYQWIGGMFGKPGQKQC